MEERICVTGAGGFVGHHLCKRLKADGHWVRGVDIRRPPYEESPVDEFLLEDLRDRDVAKAALDGVSQVYALAADMGGMGFISGFQSPIIENNLRINLNTIQAARQSMTCKELLFTSSACVYPMHRLRKLGNAAIHEYEAHPAAPQESYGWEKLTTEQLLYYHTRERRRPFAHSVRFFNIYGPLCAWTGGREKAPAALCRKIAEAKWSGRHEIDVWGDGRQERAFTYIDDAVEGLIRTMEKRYLYPVHIGLAQRISIRDLCWLISEIAGYEVGLVLDPDGPEGVRSRVPSNERIQALLGWEPTIGWEEGMTKLYHWVEKQVLGAA